MTRRPALVAGLTLGLLAVGACDQELPTDVGAELVPEAQLRTYEVLLADLAFLASDTIVRGFGTAPVAPALYVARDWRDTLNANALVRFGRFPETITYVDSGVTRTDTVARYVGGSITLRVDTASLGLDTLGTDTTIAFEMYAIGESFDPRTATWTARRIEGTDSTLWTTPGGTPGALIGSGSWTRSDTVAGDTIVFQVDSAQIAAWQEATDADARGILVTTTTAGARAQVVVPRLNLAARLDPAADTTRTVSAVVSGQTWVFDPPAPAPVDELRLGDRSAWRSFLVFRDALDTVTVTCPGGPIDCSFQLGEVTVNRAELVLTPLPVSEVYRPRGNFGVETRPVLGDASLSLERAPLGDTTGVALSVSPDFFDGVDDPTVSITVTRFVRGLLDAGGDTTVTVRNRTLAVSSVPEPLPYGIARFAPVGAAEGAPMLRLIVTVPEREEDE